MRLVGPNGEPVGIVRIEDALRVAQDADLDLVEVAPDARPPVCKLMDYGKFKYESAMKARDARRNQASTVLKEIRFRLKIDPHDYGTKKGHVERFLAAGDKVKIMIMFRGREQSRPEAGMRLLQRLAEDVAELGVVESAPRLDGRNMIMVLAPTKKKAGVRAEPRRRPREAAEMPAEAGAADSRPAGVPAAPVNVAQAPPPARPAATSPARPAPQPRPAAAPASAPSAAPGPASQPRPVPRTVRPAAPQPRPEQPRPAAPRTGPAVTGGADAGAGRPVPAPRPTPVPRPSAPTPNATSRPAATPKPPSTPRRPPSPDGG